MSISLWDVQIEDCAHPSVPFAIAPLLKNNNLVLLLHNAILSYYNNDSWIADIIQHFMTFVTYLWSYFRTVQCPETNYRAVAHNAPVCVSSGLNLNTAHYSVV